MIAISVIIPVYNCEEYLEDCLQSLLSQTLKNIEFIFVNDGSVDKSKEIIQNSVKKDSRIKLITQKNQGVSVARNIGLNHAKGEYIGFVDGDDFIEHDMYEILINRAHEYNLDIVISNFITEQDGLKTVAKPYFTTEIIYDKQFIQENIIPFLIKADGLNTSCNKIYKADFVKKNNIIFPENKQLGEDALFNLQAFNCAQNIVFVKYAGYHYREVFGSATRNILNKDYFQKALEVYRADYTSHYGISLKKEVVKELKAIRFIDKVTSIVHIYLGPNNNMNFKTRIKAVKKIIRNSEVQMALHNYFSSINKTQNKYKQFILFCLKNKLMIGLILAVNYSNSKNKK